MRGALSLPEVLRMCTFLFCKLLVVQLTTVQQVFVVTQFTLIPNLTAVQNAFRIRFPDRNPPVRNTILKNVRKYQSTETSLKRKLLCLLLESNAVSKIRTFSQSPFWYSFNVRGEIYCGKAL